ncbi:MAG: hypothetical protein NHG14_00755 [Candidatus Shikimatogenerans bostrichidophilus]|nr:MAG: hypothetical protein NHG14_00755 [Candidatus Shikimatogenerans bostrichidophilus]
MNINKGSNNNKTFIDYKNKKIYIININNIYKYIILNFYKNERKISYYILLFPYKIIIPQNLNLIKLKFLLNKLKIKYIINNYNLYLYSMPIFIPIEKIYIFFYRFFYELIKKKKIDINKLFLLMFINFVYKKTKINKLLSNIKFLIYFIKKIYKIN